MAAHGQKYDSSFEQVLHKRSDLHILRKLWHMTSGSLVLYVYLRSEESKYMMGHFVLAIALMGFAIVAGLIGAASELISAFNIDDNLTIPVLSGLGMTLLNHFVTVYP